MKENSFLLGNYLLFLITGALVVAFQKSAWFQVFGALPSPQLWIPVLVFWFLYREPHESVIMTYLLTAMVSTQTSLGFTHFLTVNVFLFALVWLLKQRFYWSGSGFYTIICGGVTFGFFLCHWILSLLIENNPLSFPNLFSWILSPFLTMFFALIFYYGFSLLDMLTHKELPREASGGIS